MIGEHNKNISSMQNSKIQSPRISQEFIGLGKDFQSKKRVRKQLDFQELCLKNRVTFYHKEKNRAEKNVVQSQIKLEKILQAQQRHENDLREKARMMQERLTQEERQREKNSFERMMSRTRRLQGQANLQRLNKMDYEKVKNLSLQGSLLKQKNKKNQKEEKKNSWLMIKLSKERGKSQLDNFYLTKNKIFVSDYYKKISMELSKSEQKINSIHELKDEEKKIEEKFRKTVAKADFLNDKIMKIKNSRVMANSSQCSEEFVKKSNKQSQTEEREDFSVDENKQQIEDHHLEEKEEKENNPIEEREEIIGSQEGTNNKE